MAQARPSVEAIRAARAAHAIAAAMTRTGLLGGSFNPAHQRAPAHQPRRAGRARARRDLVAGLAGQSAEAEEGHGAARRALRLGPPRRPPRADPASPRSSASSARVYTVDTLAALVRRYPGPALHLADGRRQSRPVPPLARLAEDRRAPCRLRSIGRPGYDGAALKAPAWGWLRRFVRPAAMARNWTEWRPPALVLLAIAARSDIRHRHPRRQSRLARIRNEIVSTQGAVRDGVTRRPIS